MRFIFSSKYPFVFLRAKVGHHREGNFLAYPPSFFLFSKKDNNLKKEINKWVS